MISARNYAAQAERGVVQWISGLHDYRHKSNDAEVCALFARTVKDAVHFAIPDNGEILKDDLRGLSGMQVRLPYPVITVEFFVDDSQSQHHELTPTYVPRRLVLAFEGRREELRTLFARIIKETGVDMSRFLHDEELIVIMVANEIAGEWSMCPMAWIMPTGWDDHRTDPDSVMMVPPLIPPQSPVAVGGIPFPVLIGLGSLRIEALGAERAMQYMMHDIGGEIKAVLELCEALSCKNITAESIQHENKNTNARRAKSGKLPIYETKILVIDSSSAPAKKHGGDRNNASPRQHLRRGHIRRLEKGNVWVNSCVVGDPTKGRIDKQYHVRP